MIRRAYVTDPPGEKVRKAAAHVVDLLVSEGMTFGETCDALDYAQDLLMRTTRPQQVTGAALTED